MILSGGSRPRPLSDGGWRCARRRRECADRASRLCFSPQRVSATVLAEWQGHQKGRPQFFRFRRALNISSIQETCLAGFGCHRSRLGRLQSSLVCRPGPPLPPSVGGLLKTPKAGLAVQ